MQNAQLFSTGVKKADTDITPKAYAIYAAFKNPDNKFTHYDYEVVEFISKRIPAKDRAKELNLELEQKKENPGMFKLFKKFPDKYIAKSVSGFNFKDHYLKLDFSSFRECDDMPGWELDAKFIYKELFINNHGELFYDLIKDTVFEFDDCFGDGVWIDQESQTFGFSNNGLYALIDEPEELEDFLREHFLGEATFAIKGLMRKTRENCY